MIVTVTLNPSLDRTIDIDRLEPGAVHRARAVHLHPGGKGVNVTRALLRNGTPSVAVLPVGGPQGDQLVGLLEAERVAHALVPVRTDTRSNITVAEADGTTTKLNEPGGTLEAADLAAITTRTLAEAAPGDWIVLCGSLPPGAPIDTYARATRALHAAEMRVVVDTSGPALAACLGAEPGGLPDLVKPNAEELADAVGRPLTRLADVIEAALQVVRAGVPRVLVSLGAAGAVLADGDGVVVGRSFAATPRSSVGAGDAFLAGYLSAEADPDAGGPRAALQRALTWGAAAVQLPGSAMPGPADIDPDSAHLLSDTQHHAALETLVV